MSYRLQSQPAAKAPAVYTRGPGLLGLLFLVLLVLKVTGYISISWLVVTLPLWGGLAASLVLLAAAGLILGGIKMLDKLGRIK